jgi:hypothetical protein
MTQLNFGLRGSVWEVSQNRLLTTVGFCGWPIITAKSAKKKVLSTIGIAVEDLRGLTLTARRNAAYQQYRKKKRDQLNSAT